MFRLTIHSLLSSLFLMSVMQGQCVAHSLTEVVSATKSSVVGIGRYNAMASQTHQLRGTGFVVGDGSLIVTNYHVVSQPLDSKIVEYHIVFAGIGRKPNIYKVELLDVDQEHDIALLKMSEKLQPIRLAGDDFVADGSEILLTGFPIGAVLGLYPATHRGIVAATTPDVIPTANAQNLNNTIIERLQNPQFIYQLDITAYPGNSGSPVYLSETGEVIGILNKVFIKETKETVLEKPSGISYAIPISHLRKLAKRNGIAL
ncbi:MAG: trypsin-like peptidase domain-containing protein [Paraglaciecola sp.]|nr:trypsin-like peptidase domain-containing protein [Paraglaciecola sp.]NCT49510.1 trypsin-like peptidase domain-containing protein [Paraglaciecola sp.]